LHMTMITEQPTHQFQIEGLIIDHQHGGFGD